VSLKNPLCSVFLLLYVGLALISQGVINPLV